MADAVKIPATRFVDWLRGYLDAVGDAGLTPEQIKRVVDELEKLVAIAAATPVEKIDWQKLIPQNPTHPLWPGYVGGTTYGGVTYGAIDTKPNTTCAAPMNAGSTWNVPLTFQENKQ